MEAEIKSFRDLRVWQSAYELTLEIYKLVKDFPSGEKFGLSSQMSRASISVCSNIAEGFGRRSFREKDQFYAMANGSLTELETQLLIAHGVGFISRDAFSVTYSLCESTHKQLVVLQQVNKSKGA